MGFADVFFWTLIAAVGAFFVTSRLTRRFMPGDGIGGAMVTIGATILAALVALIFSAWSALGHELATTYRVTVTRVIDADTFEGQLHLDGLPGVRGAEVNIRLACINSPERYTPAGAALKEIVRDWIEGRDLFISHLADGGFGRLLARVHDPGRAETVSQRLYRYEPIPSPLYTGTQTTKAKIEACRQRMEP